MIGPRRNRSDREDSLAATPVFAGPRNGAFGFGGFVGERLRVNEQAWLLRATH